MNDEQEYLKDLRKIGIALNIHFNSLWGDTGFVLLLIDPETPSNINQISNLSKKMTTEALEAALSLINSDSPETYITTLFNPGKN